MTNELAISDDLMRAINAFHIIDHIFDDAHTLGDVETAKLVYLAALNIIEAAGPFGASQEEWSSVVAALAATRKQLSELGASLDGIMADKLAQRIRKP
jgi:hypothetical protein